MPSPATPAPVTLAVAGAGLIGKRHIEHIAASSEATLAAIVDPAPAGEAMAAAYNVPWFANIAAMTAKLTGAARPQGIVIATPNQLHTENGLDAIAAGIPALVEKPIADTVASALKLVEAAEKAKVPLLTGHHRRHNPMIARAKEVVTSGRLGQIVAVHGFFWLLKPDDYFNEPWRRAKGAGPVFVNLIHDVDLMRHLVGEVTAVQAIEQRNIRGNEVEETAVVLLRFVNGALGTVNVSDAIVAPWSWEHTASENPAYPQTDQICLHIGGTKGSLAIPRLEVWTHKDKQSWMEPLSAERVHAPPQDPLRLQIANFAAVIRGTAQPVVSGRDGLRTLAVIEAVKQAAKNGGEVKVAAV